MGRSNLLFGSYWIERERGSDLQQACQWSSWCGGRQWLMAEMVKSFLFWVVPLLLQQLHLTHLNLLLSMKHWSAATLRKNLYAFCKFPTCMRRLVVSIYGHTSHEDKNFKYGPLVTWYMAWMMRNLSWCSTYTSLTFIEKCTSVEESSQELDGSYSFVQWILVEIHGGCC